MSKVDDLLSELNALDDDLDRRQRARLQKASSSEVEVDVAARLEEELLSVEEERNRRSTPASPTISPVNVPASSGGSFMKRLQARNASGASSQRQRSPSSPSPPRKSKSFISSLKDKVRSTRNSSIESDLTTPLSKSASTNYKVPTDPAALYRAQSEKSPRDAHGSNAGPGGARILKARQTAPCHMDGEHDLTLQDWYHGNISGSEANQLLSSMPVGCFLVRTSAQRARVFVISVVSEKKEVQHITLVRDGDDDTAKWMIEGTSSDKRFSSVARVIECLPTVFRAPLSNLGKWGT